MSDSFVGSWLANPFVYRLVLIVIGLVAIYVVHRLLQRSIARYVTDSQARYRSRKAASYAVFVLSLLILVTVFSDRLGGLTVAFGVAGAGIAFALQEVIASSAGWVAVSFGNFYSPGDRVQLGGIKGDVIDVGVLRTTLMEVGEWVNGDLYNGRIVRVANSFVFKEPVFNYSADFPFLWDEIVIPVRYGSDWKMARTMLEDVGKEVCGDFAEQSRAAWQQAVTKYRLEPANVEPMVTMVANDNWLEFTLRYVVDYRRRRITKHMLFTRVLEQVDASGDAIRLASATFEITNLPAFDLTHGEGRSTVQGRYVP